MQKALLVAMQDARRLCDGTAVISSPWGHGPQPLCLVWMLDVPCCIGCAPVLRMLSSCEVGGGVKAGQSDWQEGLLWSGPATAGLCEGACVQGCYLRLCKTRMTR